MLLYHFSDACIQYAITIIQASNGHVREDSNSVLDAVVWNRSAIAHAAFGVCYISCSSFIIKASHYSIHPNNDKYLPFT